MTNIDDDSCIMLLNNVKDFDCYLNYGSKRDSFYFLHGESKENNYFFIFSKIEPSSNNNFFVISTGAKLSDEFGLISGKLCLNGAIEDIMDTSLDKIIDKIIKLFPETQISLSSIYQKEETTDTLFLNNQEIIDQVMEDFISPKR